MSIFKAGVHVGVGLCMTAGIREISRGRLQSHPETNNAQGNPRHGFKREIILSPEIFILGVLKMQYPLFY